MSIHSASNSESGICNYEEAPFENRRAELWDSSKKKKVKRGGLAEKWEEMIKNESSDRALKEHFKDKDSSMVSTFAHNLLLLKGTVLEYEKGLDDLIRLRCKKVDMDNNCQSFSSVSEIFEVILNKTEKSEFNLPCDIKGIKLQKPFVEVQIHDYHPLRKNEILTVISNPSHVEMIS